MPGSAFLRPEDELTVRFCYVDFDASPIIDGELNDVHQMIQDKEKFVAEIAPKIAAGIERLVRFVEKYSA